MSRHPSTIATPGTALPTMNSNSYIPSFNVFLYIERWFEKISLTSETSHELFDRLDYQRVNGGELIYTDDGPRLDDDNETLFLIWRGQRS